MGQEYVKYVTVLNAFNSAPQDGLLDEFETVSAFASIGVGTVAITRTTADVFSGAGAMSVAITGTASQSPAIKRILPFPQQRYQVLEFAIGQRAGNVFTKQLTFDILYYSSSKQGRARFAFQNWDNDILTIQVYDASVPGYVNLATAVPVPFEGKTFFIVRALIDTFDRKWVYLDVAGERYDLSQYSLETVTSATDPDGNNCARLLITAQSMALANTLNYVVDRFKWQGTTYPQ
jgi:hypothetical protein